MKVLVLGAGKMVQAILLGLKHTEDLSQWMIFSPSGTSAKNLANQMGAQHVADLSVASEADFILVGCKPQQLLSLKETIGDRFKNTLFVSLLAAVSEKDQLRTLGARELIRCMPNLPVEFRKGVVLLSSKSARDKVVSFQRLFSKLGMGLVVSEDELEELTLLTGSGPALFYEFTQRLSEAFHSLDSLKREELARAVLMGAAITVEKDQASLQELVKRVTSKGGVTIAVLEAWRREGFGGFLRKGIEQGKLRAEEIKSLIRS